MLYDVLIFFFSSRRRHTRFSRDWSSDVCSSDLSEKFDLDNFPVDFIANFIYHSLSFESQNLTLEAVKNVLEDQPSTLEEKRVIAIKNYRKAIDFVFEKVKNKEDLDENALKDLHEILMDEVNVGGLYRNVD